MEQTHENIFEKIGKALADAWHWIGGLFNAAQHAWDKIDPKVQDALKKGAGIVDTINKNLEATPDFIFDLITQKWPDLTKEKAEEILKQAASKLKLADDIEDADLFTTIKNLQQYLSTLQGKFWEGASSTLAQLIAIAAAPPDTPFAAISMLIEFVYNKFFKK